MDWSFALDIFVAGLLAVTIGFAAVLNHRLGKLRRDRDALEKTAVQFRQATAHAEESVGKMRVSTDTLQETIDKAQSLFDDLTYLIDRGSTIADRIEREIRATRPHRQAAAAPSLSAAAQLRPNGSGTDVKPRSEAERDLLNALQSEL